jgi:hypothetical protein
MFWRGLKPPPPSFHARDADVAVLVGRDLDVADECGRDVDRRGRRDPAVDGVRSLNGSATDGEAVPRDVCAPVEGAVGIVVHPHRLAVVTGARVDKAGGGPRDAVGRAPAAQTAATTAAPRKTAIQLPCIS